MAVLKNRTKRDNFLVVSRIFLQDNRLNLNERGLLSTMHSLPDEWNFTIKGLSMIIPDGEAKIKTAMNGLIKKGYVSKRQSKEDGGKFGKNIIEIFEQPIKSEPLAEKTATDSSVTEKSLSEKTEQYNSNKYNSNLDSNNQSINHQYGESDEEDPQEEYRLLIASNIKLADLLKVASNRCDDEVKMVNEVYEIICDMVCYPRKSVNIKGTLYPWDVVKSQFLKLRYEHVADVLNRVVDEELGIKNMAAYIVSMLYFSSLAGTLEIQASIHDDYLKFLRGKPY